MKETGIDRDDITFVQRIAYKVATSRNVILIVDDLISAGLEAVVRRKGLFDKTKGASIETYLYGHIHWAIQNEINRWYHYKSQVVYLEDHPEIEMVLTVSIEEIIEFDLMMDYIRKKAENYPIILSLLELKMMGFNQRDIARIRNCSPANISMLMTRFIEKLEIRV